MARSAELHPPTLAYRPPSSPKPILQAVVAPTLFCVTAFATSIPALAALIAWPLPVHALEFLRVAIALLGPAMLICGGIVTVLSARAGAWIALMSMIPLWVTWGPLSYTLMAEPLNHLMLFVVVVVLLLLGSSTIAVALLREHGNRHLTVRRIR